MIKIERPADAIPSGLAKNGAAELRRNRHLKKIVAHALTQKPRVKAPKHQVMVFKAYSKDKVKNALSALFHRKCAFCDSTLLGTQAGDVEHYRPKGEVTIIGPNGKPTNILGYFWLAARWDNLLIACADCNRPRTQLDYDHKQRVIGKSTFFPLADENKRAAGVRKIRDEEPLLINPCSNDVNDHPNKHFKMRADGIIDVLSEDGVVSKKGAATIHYCGLNRLELIQMRAKHARIVAAAIRHTLDSLQRGNDPGADLDDLVELLKPQSPYLALTHLLIKEQLEPQLEKLGLNLDLLPATAS